MATTAGSGQYFFVQFGRMPRVSLWVSRPSVARQWAADWEALFFSGEAVIFRSTQRLSDLENRLKMASVS
ncbi:MAG: hypothetical protein JXB85_08940 [Anaerolineales bacterium]|nr:hypothetical protein [Anaerolineales bacterium]